MRQRAVFSAALACAGVLFLLSCSESKKTTGVTEGGNTGAIAGIVVDSAGNPVENALVRLRAASYVKSVSGTPVALLKVSQALDSTQDSLPALDTYTNLNGEYLLDSVPVGEYSIETRYLDSSSNKVLATWRTATLLEDKPLELAPDTLRKPAIVRGIVSDTLLARGYYYVQVIGLDRIEEVNKETGAFEIDELPPGTFQIRFVTSDEKNEPARTIELKVDEDDEDELGEVEGEEDSEELESEDSIENDSLPAELEDSELAEEEPTIET